LGRLGFQAKAFFSRDLGLKKRRPWPARLKAFQAAAAHAFQGEESLALQSEASALKS
jgi:hypothetical protein